MRRFLRQHSLLIIIAVLGLLSEALFVWSEWHYYVDQSTSHHESPGSFWGAQHMHDLLYNAASNWQSELLFGFVVIYLFKGFGARERSED